jgi:hypothetical protein
MMIPVLHVMRTYGVHGGERQLAQLFRGNPGGRFSDAFAFVYRDDGCKRYFAGIAKLRLVNLLPLKAYIHRWAWKWRFCFCFFQPSRSA